jgi:hypothetical protein
MEQPTDSTGGGGAATVIPNRPLPNENLLDLDDVGDIGFSSSRVEESNRTTGVSGGRNGKRGIPCTLPDDFLRVTCSVVIISSLSNSFQDKKLINNIFVMNN